MAETEIAEWRGTDEAQLEGLAEVLYAAVHAGASVSFILPFSMNEARAFWLDKIRPDVLRRKRRVLIARTDGMLAGTVQLNLDVPPNQAHRAEVVKLLVHPSARRRGVARALMTGIEEIARAEGRTLLTLDTRTGDAAEPLYLSLGYVLAGVIPRYARHATESRLESTSIMYKELTA
jgi:GNAT superfamily N-acetyltransferase